ncbi:MAG: H-NS histone family protein [Burkholderiaceae bacterium]|jgi:DNA-binding protein H-NS|nr:H-NS histone family protein [Burkholderiaceae bacterium]
MTSYKDLLKQREALEAQIAQAREREISQAVSQVRALVAEFGLSAQDVFPTAVRVKSSGGAKGQKVAPKYRNPATGETWTGRGKPPKWIAGKDRTEFTIA